MGRLPDWWKKKRWPVAGVLNEVVQAMADALLKITPKPIDGLGFPDPLKTFKVYKMPGQTLVPAVDVTIDAVNNTLKVKNGIPGVGTFGFAFSQVDMDDNEGPLSNTMSVTATSGVPVAGTLNSVEIVPQT